MHTQKHYASPTTELFETTLEVGFAQSDTVTLPDTSWDETEIIW